MSNTRKNTSQIEHDGWDVDKRVDFVIEKHITRVFSVNKKIALYSYVEKIHRRVIRIWIKTRELIWRSVCVICLI